jgi:hypothetical protein
VRARLDTDSIHRGRATRAPEPSRPTDALLALQRAAGNRAVAALISRAHGAHGLRTIAREFDEQFETGLDLFTKATRKMDFSFTGRPPMYDADCWTCFLLLTPTDNSPKERREYAGETGAVWKALVKKYEEIEFEYVLKPNVKPSFAIREIPRKSERWAMDCIDYVVAARLYAECRGLGDEAFDAKYSNLGTEIAPAPMRMAQHDTPGLSASDFWRREAKATEFMSKTSQEPATGVAPKDASEEDAFLAEKVPIGARVMWTTTHPKAAEDMENENTIKIGPDLYAAHPLGRISANKVRKELVVDDKRAAQEITEHIYLAEIEWYNRR